MSAAITPVPTWEDVEKARLAKLDAWLEWVMSDNSEDLWAEYMLKIKIAADLEHDRHQANLKEVLQ